VSKVKPYADFADDASSIASALPFVIRKLGCFENSETSIIVEISRVLPLLNHAALPMAFSGDLSDDRCQIEEAGHEQNLWLTAPRCLETDMGHHAGIFNALACYSWGVWCIHRMYVVDAKAMIAFLRTKDPVDFSKVSRPRYSKLRSMRR
jgi:hypothetical protein